MALLSGRPFKVSSTVESRLRPRYLGVVLCNMARVPTAGRRHPHSSHEYVGSAHTAFRQREDICMRAYTDFFFGTSIILLFAVVSHAEIQTVAEHNGNEAATPEFRFKNVPSPSRNDAATTANFTIVNGRRDPNGGTVELLRDGRVPIDEDRPSENFFFGAGTTGGRLLVDLGAITEVRKVNTYSWHSNTRGPQVYKLYAADGNADDFASQPKQGTSPEKCGWKLVADVDARPKEGAAGGQYGVSISDSSGVLGKYRYLLFDVSRTESTDPFGNTFYSEIDVDDGQAREVVTPSAPERRREIVETDGGTYRIIIDTTEAPNLAQSAHNELAPVVRDWYPKIVKMLPSEGYEAPRRSSLRSVRGCEVWRRPAGHMCGVPRVG